MGESTALPQSTTNDRVSNKICYVYMNLFTKMMYNENNFHLVQNRISTAVVAVVASIASVQFFILGPILDFILSHRQVGTTFGPHSQSRRSHFHDNGTATR